MKRQRSRNRGGGGGGGGGGKPQHNANRAFDSNGPDGVKIRGNAQHVFEKYQQLARDAASSGDRVLAESYLQHAEHYFRVLRAVQPQRPASEIIGRDAFTSGIDIDFEDESGGGEAMEAETAEGAPEDGGEGRRDDRSEPRGENGRQEYRDRGEYRDGRRPDYRQGDRPEGRQDQGRYEGRRDDRGYRDDRPRDRDRDRDRNYRDDRPRDRDRYEGQGRNENRPREGADPLPVVEPEATPLPRAVAEDTSHTLRSHDGGFSPAPAFLQARSEAPASEEAAEPAPEAAPRRRRTRGPRPAEDAPASTDES